jgi:hypothetical protein
MHEAGQSKISLVVAEIGSEWRAPSRPDPDLEVVLIAQDEGEDPSLFARRCLKAVGEELKRHVDIVSAVLAVNSIFDVRRLEARCAIARALLRALGDKPETELLLLGLPSAPEACHSHLIALAEGLAEGASAQCHVSFGWEGPRKHARAVGTEAEPTAVCA